MTRTRLIVGLIISHRTNLTITKTRKGRPRPDPGCRATDDDDDSTRVHRVSMGVIGALNKANIRMKSIFFGMSVRLYETASLWVNAS
jgi:hypothetical protein